MSPKTGEVIPFVAPSKPSDPPKDGGKVLPFVGELKSKGPKLLSGDGPVIDHGTIGSFDYEIFQRGVIHIFDKKKKHLFKKNMDMFEEELENFDPESFCEGDTFKIGGSGDNDDLIFFWKDGEVDLKLEHKVLGVVDKLKKLLKKRPKDTKAEVK